MMCIQRQNLSNAAMQQRTSTVNLSLCWLLLFFVCLVLCGWLVVFVFAVVVEFFCLMMDCWSHGGK